jgi:hypothetical protein
MISTIMIFTLTSISDAEAIPNAVFGKGLVPFRIAILVMIMTVLFAMHKFWTWGIDNTKHRWFTRTSTDMNLVIICLGFLVAVGWARPEHLRWVLKGYSGGYVRATRL